MASLWPLNSGHPAKRTLKNAFAPDDEVGVSNTEARPSALTQAFAELTHDR